MPPQTLDSQKLKRLGGLEFRGGIARIGMALVGAQVQLHDLAGLRIEIQCLEIDPEGIGCESRLEEVQLALVVKHRTPAGGRDIGLIGRADAVGYRDIADHAEHAGQCLVGIGVLGNGVHIERGPRKAIGCAVGAGQHDRAADLLPVAVERQLLIEGGRVCHHLVLAAMVNDLLALDVFDDGAVAAGVRHGQMQGGQAALSGHIVRDNGEGLLLQRGHCLLHAGKVVQHILRPGGNRQPGFALGIKARILGLHQPQQVGVETGFIDAVRGRDVIARSDDAAVFGFPAQRVRAGLTVAFHAARQHPEIADNVAFPVHGAGRHDLTVDTVEHQAGAGPGAGGSGHS